MGDLLNGLRTFDAVRDGEAGGDEVNRRVVEPIAPVYAQDGVLERLGKRVRPVWTAVGSSVCISTSRTRWCRRENPAVGTGVAIVARPGQAQGRGVGGGAAGKGPIGPFAPPEFKCQPVRCSHRAMRVMSESTSGGVRRAPMPA